MKQYTLEQLYDYNVCPLRHHFKNTLNIQPNIEIAQPSVEYIEHKEKMSVRDSIIKYFEELCGNNIWSVKDVIDYYIVNSYGYANVIELFYDSNNRKGENLVSQKHVKIQILTTIYKYITSVRFTPIASNLQTVLDIQGFQIHTPIDIVRDIEGFSQLMVMSEIFNKKDKWHHYGDYGPMVQYLAFKQVFGALPKSTIILPLAGIKPHELSMSDYSNTQRLDSYIYNTCRRMESEDPFPTYSNACFQCAYRYPCKKYKT